MVLNAFITSSKIKLNTSRALFLCQKHLNFGLESLVIGRFPLLLLQWAGSMGGINFKIIYARIHLHRAKKRCKAKRGRYSKVAIFYVIVSCDIYYTKLFAANLNNAN